MTTAEIGYKSPPIQKTSLMPTGQGRQNRVTIEFVIQTLCPIHLGCDEVYDPLSFALDPETSELIVFDPSEFLENLSDSELKQFSNICREGTLSSIIKIYNFMRNKKPLGRRVGICSGFLGHYDRALSISERDQRRIQQELSNFIINRTAYLPTTDRPYIPGTAIKGSIRTAYLNSLASHKKVNPERGKGKDLEKQLLDGGAFVTDPFRLLKVSDFMPVGEIKTKIVYAVNEKKKPSPHEARGPYQIIETIEPGSWFTGSIIVEQPEQGANIRNPIKIGMITGSLKSFYSKEKNLENQALQSVNIPVHEVVSDGATLLRLGRHSGAESLTIEGFRDIRIMLGGGKSKYLPHSTTIWLASEFDKPKNRNSLKPFGWATLTPITADQKAQFMAKEADWRRIAEDNRSVVLQQIQERISNLTEARGVSVVSRPSVPASPQSESWQGATLTWNPGRAELIAQFGTKKASSKVKEIVPEAMRKNVFNKKKPVKCDVEVDGSFKITRIE